MKQDFKAELEDIERKQIQEDSERIDMLADLKRKEDYSYCACGNLLLTEQEQRYGICRECV